MSLEQHENFKNASQQLKSLIVSPWDEKYNNNYLESVGIGQSIYSTYTKVNKKMSSSSVWRWEGAESDLL